MTHPILENLSRQLAYRDSVQPSLASEGVRSLLTRINQRLLDELGPELFPHGKYMTAPAQNIDGVDLITVSRPLKVRYSFELAEDISIVSVNAEDELTAIICSEAVEELRAIYAEAPDAEFIPFILLDTAGVMIDPNTMEPVVRFLTRFARLRKDEHQLVKNARNQFKWTGTQPNPLLERVTVDITSRLVERHGTELFRSNVVMTGPVHAVGDLIIEAKTRKLATRLVLPEVVSEDWSKEEFDRTLDLCIDNAVEAIYREIKTELDEAENRHIVMVPYIVVATSGIIVSPQTGSPQIGFMTRYGTATEEALGQSLAREHIRQTLTPNR